MTREEERKEEGGGEQRCLRWKEDGKDGGIDGWMDARGLPSFSPIAAIDKSAVGHRKLLLGA